MKKKTKFYVAVVVAREGRASLRKYGDWSCFLAASEADAVGAAGRSLGEWQGVGGNFYDVLVGEITGRVVEPTNYKVVRL